jgi:hypothetical protein
MAPVAPFPTAISRPSVPAFTAALIWDSASCRRCVVVLFTARGEHPLICLNLYQESKVSSEEKSRHLFH